MAKLACSMRAKDVQRPDSKGLMSLEDAEIGVQHLYLRFAFRFQFFLIQLKSCPPAFFHCFLFLLLSHPSN